MIPPLNSGLPAISEGIEIVVVVIRRTGASGVVVETIAGDDAALYDACCTR
jgi:hypothetical protein